MAPTLEQMRKKLAEQQRLLGQELRQSEITRQKTIEQFKVMHQNAPKSVQRDENNPLVRAIQPFIHIVEKFDKTQSPPAPPAPPVLARQSSDERDKYAKRMAALAKARAAREVNQARKDGIHQSRLSSLKKARRAKGKKVEMAKVKAGTKVTLKPKKKGQKPITFTSGGLHKSTGTPAGKKIPASKVNAALSGGLGAKAKKQALFKKNVLIGRRKGKK
jgi:hypothetical protein